MGLLDGLLPGIYSAGDTAKRKIRGLLDDPSGTIAQFIGNENDRAGQFNQLTRSATDEMVNRIRNGGGMGASEQRLAGLLADAYNPAGITVWHGSPHRFTKFDSSKIGTGEGAQAYGHGLYLAESPDVARGYAKKLTDSQNLIGASGKTYSTTFNADSRAMDEAVHLIKSGMYKSIDEAIESTSQILSSLKEGDPRITPLKDRLYAYKSMADDAVRVPEAQLYKVDLPDEHIAKMLDWDKPLSQQAPEVQKALQAKQVQDSIAKLKASGKLGGYSPAELQQFKGEDWYDMLRQASGDSNAAPSDFLRQQGIPGIRYLDGGSRGIGQGTSNFVVFPGNENLLQILERNGQPMGLLGQ